MDQGDLDDIFSQMLGELDDLTQQLDAVPSVTVVPPPAAPKPPAAARQPPAAAPKPLPKSKEDVDLSAMLDDLCMFEENLVDTNASLSVKSTSQDSGIGFRSDSLNRNTKYLTVEEGGQKFDTLKRSGAIALSQASGGFQLDDDEEDLSLDALSKDLDIEQKQAKAQALSEEELATLSPMLLELDDLVESLASIKTNAESQSATSVSENEQPKKISLPILNETKPSAVDNAPGEQLQPVQVPPRPSKPVPPAVSKKPKLIKSSNNESFRNEEKISDLPVDDSAVHESESDKHKSSSVNDVEPVSVNDVEPVSVNDDNLTSDKNLLSASERVSHFTMPCQPSESSSRPETLAQKSIVSRTSSTDSESTTHIVRKNSVIEAGEANLRMLESMDSNEISAEEREERIRSEKMKIALEKMKEARIQKLVVKVYNKDESSKTMMIDERMIVRSVMKQLVEKNHFDFSPNWALIEELPTMYMERMFEEHEKPCELLTYWTRDSTNQLRFVERKDKYALFKNPQHYLLSHTDRQEQMQERHKQTLLEEFFSGKGPSSGVPEVEGFLHIKGDGKSWSRKYCVLRQSGLYVSKSGEPKKGKKLSDLACLVMFEQYLLYLGRGWKKKFKSPFEYGFALKHPAIQVKSKHIRYLCCEDFKSLMRWTVGIRLAKYGRQLLENYEKTNEEMKSTSATTSVFAFKQKPIQPDAQSTKSTDSGGGGSRPNTLPRGVGVKDIFAGAWARANQDVQTETKPSSYETSSQASPINNSGVSRTKSVFKPNAKKSNNWWELEQEQPEESPESSPFHRSDRHASSSGSSEVISAVPESLPGPPQDYYGHNEPSFDQSNLPPPPPMDDFADLPPPPPPVAYGSKPPPPMVPPKSSKMPPPPPAKPKPSLPTRHDNTFMSYNDLPPPPPPAPAPPPVQASRPKPPPVARRPQHYNHSNNNNNNLPNSLSRDSLEEEPPPPSFHPPPPQKDVPDERQKALDKLRTHVAPDMPFQASPLASYYTNQSSHVNNYSRDGFPPPPDFIGDLKQSFSAVAQSTGSLNVEDMLLDLPPAPQNVLTYIKHQTFPRISGRRDSKKGPPPPRRSAGTRLSAKRQ